MKSAALAALLLSTAAATAAAPCGAALDAATRRQIDGASHVLVFAPRGGPVAVGRHFQLDIVVCPRDGGTPPAALRVDADMPAHRHGMNYRASVQALGAGVFRAEGLMFHMPGRWRFLFDVETAGRSVRLAHEVDLP